MQKFLGILLVCFSHLTSALNDNNLVVLLLDGARWDYFSRPNNHLGYETIKREGVVAEYVQPIFPSVSYPSWTTINTGLYPENHGLVGNYIFDPETKQEFNILNDTSAADPFWWTGQHVPIWTTFTVAGLRTSLHRWSRCDIPRKIVGNLVYPEKCSPYIDADWQLDIPPALEIALNNTIRDLKSGIRVSLVYYIGIDNVGHDYGPDTPEMTIEVKAVDNAIDRFMSMLESEGLSSKTNFVIVSDHGMSSNAEKDFEKVTDHLSNHSVQVIERIVDAGPFCMIKIDAPENVEPVYNELKASFKGMEVFLKKDIPDYLHYKNHPFILDILLISKGQVSIGRDKAHKDLYLPTGDGDESQSSQRSGATHGYKDITEGYNNDGPYPNVRGIFMAKGPAFKTGYSQPWIKLVDIYQILLKTMEVEGEQHEGNWSRVQGMFKSDSNSDWNPQVNLLILIFSMSLNALINW